MTAWLANALSEKHSVTILGLTQKGTPNVSINSSVCQKTVNSDSDNKKIIHTVSKLRHILRKEGFDYLINVDIGMSIYGIPAAFGLGTKVITWEHGNFYNNWGSRWFPYFRRFAAKCSDAMVVLTERDKENYRQHISTRKPLYVIYNPAEKHEYQYRKDSKMILSAGLLVPIKRFELAIEAASRVLPSHPDWQWVICGDGPERERLEALIREHHLEKQVLLPGTVSDMSEMYQKAAFYVMTSEREGLPMVLLEAKSWGLPIVSFDIMTGPSDIIRDGVNGYLVDYGNVEGLADRIEFLMEHPQVCREFSDASQLEMEKFDRTEIIRKWETLFSQVIRVNR